MEHTHYAIVRLTKDEARKAIEDCFNRKPETTITGKIFQVGDVRCTPILQGEIE